MTVFTRSKDLEDIEFEFLSPWVTPGAQTPKPFEHSSLWALQCSAQLQAHYVRNFSWVDTTLTSTHPR